MGFSVLCAVLDLVENLPAEDPYTTLKGRLVLALSTGVLPAW